MKPIEPNGVRFGNGKNLRPLALMDTARQFCPVRSLAIIIPAFNEEAELPSTLEALDSAIADAARSPIVIEVIVVDNNSTDATAQVARRGGARVVFEPHNQIARARNAGAAATEADALLFLDADTRIEPLLLRQTIDALASGNVAGGGAKIAFEGEIGWLGGLCIGVWNGLSRTLRLAAGSYFFLSREAWDALSGFAEHHYAGEEVELSRRLARWARGQGKTVEILRVPPALTSSRKFHWHGAWRVAILHLLLACLPFLLRSRRFCGLVSPSDARRYSPIICTPWMRILAKIVMRISATG